MNAQKHATPEHRIQDLLAKRWSPYAVACLVEGNQAWAKAAPLLALGWRRRHAACTSTR
jgi:hypothetical protein